MPATRRRTPRRGASTPALIDRKKRLIGKLENLLKGNRGIFKDELDTNFYNALKARRGGQTEEIRLQRKWLLIEDDPAVAVPPPVAYAPVAAYAPVPEPVAVAAVPASPPLTKTGEVDKRYKR